MIVTLLMVCSILYFALQLEDKYSIPTPLGLVLLAFVAHGLFAALPVITIDMPHFAELVILLLPVLLISDSLQLKLSTLKENALSLFFLAVVAVSLSVLVALWLADTLFAAYDLSFAAIILLFAMVLATDPVSVVSVFSRFELPHRLKILCEGESLFNDATALIVFVFIGLYALDGGQLDALYVINTSLVVLAGSVLVGVLVGYVGLLLMKTTSNRMAELLLLLMTGYGSFELSEKFYALLLSLGIHSHTHFSGILSCICAMLTVQFVMSKSEDYARLRMDKEEDALRQETSLKQSSMRLINRALTKIKSTSDEQQRHARTREDVQLLALVANTVLFIALAEIVDFALLQHYWREIMTMFIATTLIRAVMMAKFALLTQHVDGMVNINFRWWGVLTFAGIKGGLSIVMLMMIPPDFPYLEMFSAVVLGVVLLSTFVYSLVLIILIRSCQDSFSQELAQEKGEHHA
jgi:CPA1 family monovalent cation:H+ antiporter